MIADFKLLATVIANENNMYSYFSVQCNLVHIRSVWTERKVSQDNFMM